MRSINVSIDVFARIWALRQPNESNEDMILRRLLGCGNESEGEDSDDGSKSKSGSGFYVKRFNVLFPEGFRIFRTFKGQSHSAVVENGRWILNGGKEVFTLGDLSKEIGTSTENVWANWKYVDDSGNERFISDLRDPKTISKRDASRPTLGPDDLDQFFNEPRQSNQREGNDN